MSGGNLPYHLRHHKAIERGIFIDLLSRLSHATPSSLRQYRYIGFAGPFSEDFKLVHSHLGISRFTSIESSENVFYRQQWNSPQRGIQYLNMRSIDYVDSYQATSPSILWFDYVSPAKLGEQLGEIESLVSKLADYDVLKVTLNASHTALCPSTSTPTPPETIEQRISKARERLGKYLPVGLDVTSNDVDRIGYPALILKATELAIKSGMSGNRASLFQLLSTFTYSDSEHRMLTVTGTILPRGTKTSFLQNSGISGWNLARTRWTEPRTQPIDIVVPEMSLRERLFVDQQLPTGKSAKKIAAKLGFKLVDGEENKTINALNNYRDFYRYYPYFSRMVV